MKEGKFDGQNVERFPMAVIILIGLLLSMSNVGDDYVT